MSRRPYLHPGQPMVYAPTPGDLSRLYGKYEVDDSTPLVRGEHCWKWTGYTDAKGYGQIKIGGKPEWSHRVSYQVSRKRRLRLGEDVDHICTSRGCGNPAHLRAASRSVNSSRGAMRRHEECAAPF